MHQYKMLAGYVGNSQSHLYAFHVSTYPEFSDERALSPLSQWTNEPITIEGKMMVYYNLKALDNTFRSIRSYLFRLCAISFYQQRISLQIGGIGSLILAALDLV